jgi:hypothetical protein
MVVVRGKRFFSRGSYKNMCGAQHTKKTRMVRIYRDKVLEEVVGYLPQDVVRYIGKYLNRSWREAMPTAREQALATFKEGAGARSDNKTVRLVQLRRSMFLSTY